MQAERARFVGRRRDHAATDVIAERRERAHRRSGDRIDRFLRLMAPPPADRDRSSAELGITEKLDRRIERVHVEMRDEPSRVRGVGSHGVAPVRWTVAHP